MSQENEAEDVVDVPELTPVLDDDGNDTTDWKAIAEANRELALKNQGIAKRFKTKAEKAKETKTEATPVETKEPKSSDLDFGQKAFLKAYGIAGSDELALVKNWVSRTGDDLDSVVTDEIFTAKLTALRDAKASQNALPSASKRSSASAKDSLEYWSEKYASGTQLSDIPEDMQNKVLNARIAKDKEGRKFSSNPIVGGN